jgi:hypothetical protein
MHIEMKNRAAFISHASNDFKVADEVRRLLEDKELSCWIAPRDIAAGSSYGEQIASAIEHCSAVILILTDRANNSRPVANEIELAFRYQRVIVPIRLKEVKPSKGLEFFVSNAQWVDAIHTPLRKRIVGIEAIIRAAMTGADIPAPLPEKKSLLGSVERFLEGAVRYKLLTSLIVLGILLATGAASVFLSSGALSRLEAAQDRIDLDPATYGLVTLVAGDQDSSAKEQARLELRASIYVNLRDPAKAQMEWLVQAISSEGRASRIEIPETQLLTTSGATVATIRVPFDTSQIVFCMSAEHPYLPGRRAVSWHFKVKVDNGVVSVVRAREPEMSDAKVLKCH